MSDPRKLAADAWLKRDEEMDVYAYHLSGHFMDGFVLGYERSTVPYVQCALARRPKLQVSRACP